MNITIILWGYSNDGWKIEQNPVHPNDHVNKSQSTNDVFQQQCIFNSYLTKEKLLPSLKLLRELAKKSKEFKNIVKVGKLIYRMQHP